MSIETLKADLEEIVKATAFGSHNVDTFLINLNSFVHSQLLPWLQSAVDELGRIDSNVTEIDGAVEDIVQQSAEVLHTETADLFAGVIAGAVPLVAELEKRATGDTAILNAIKEWRALANEASQVLEEITIDDVEPDPEPESGAGSKETVQ